MSKIAVVSIKEDSLRGLEGQAAERIIKHLLSHGKGASVDVFEVDGGKAPKVRDCGMHGKYDVYVFIKGIVFITLESINNLSEIILGQRTFSLIAPVSNESGIAHQRHSPPFLYQTPTVLRWATEEIHREFKDEVMECDDLDDFCFAFRRELADNFSGDLQVGDLPKIVKKNGLKVGIAKGVYAHRYGNCYESGREDLMAHIPLDAREVLDIGCAKGLFGALLKKRQDCAVIGIEQSSEFIEIAGERLDSVINGDVEELVEKGVLGTYDCIVCGDVLEHLRNPWKVVKGLKNHLKKGGLFIASTPNIMNWAIIYDQLKGRWDYVPFSILSGTHIRFFTRDTLKDLFGNAGYAIKEMLLQSFEIPPRAAGFITSLRNIAPGISEEELRASEILVVAQG